MDTPQTRLSQLRRLAWACAVLVLAITSLSAFIRLSRAGLGCEPWPRCYAERAAMTPQALDALDTAAVRSARMAHRVVASVALLLVIFMLVKSLGQQPVLARQGRLVLGLLGLALFLAILGRMAGPSRAALVGVGNLLAGLAMFALSLRLVQATGAPSSSSTPPRAWTLAAVGLLLLQIALGGLVSVTQLSDRCGEAALCQWHRGTALVVLALLVPLGVATMRRGARGLGGVLVLLALAQAGLGLAMLWVAAVPLALGLAHNVLAGLLLATLFALLPAPAAVSPSP
ncbi:MAG TPA: COX15/CtaA family protein [Ramlibacter sp.]